MDKGICFYFGYNIDKFEMGKMIAESGLNTVMTCADPRFEHQNGNMETQMKIFKENRLKVSSLHNQYKTEELENFWKDNEIGERLEKTLISDIETAKKYGFKCVVVHTLGTFNEFGKARLERVLDVCEKNNVYLAVENIDNEHPILDIFENVKHPYLKFCYDSGHNNCFDKDFDYLSKYGDKLVCLHLHDNNGLRDQHTLNRYGTINWDKLAQKLAKLDLSNISLDYELLFYEGEKPEPRECLKEVYEQACTLENLINKYKNTKNS